MWKLTILFLLFSCSVFGQNIKHIEIVSEVQDSMILINKSDADTINKIFHVNRTLCKLNELNDSLITNLNRKIESQDSIIKTQKQILINKDLVIKEKDKNYLDKESYYKKEIKKYKFSNTIWQSISGVGVIVILIILI